MRDLLHDCDAEFSAQDRHVVIPDSAKRFRVFFEGELRGAPLFEQLRENVRGLAPNHKQSGIEFSKGTVEVFQALQQKPDDVAGIYLKTIEL